MKSLRDKEIMVLGIILATWRNVHNKLSFRLSVCNGQSKTKKKQKLR